MIINRSEKWGKNVQAAAYNGTRTFIQRKPQKIRKHLLNSNRITKQCQIVFRVFFQIICGVLRIYELYSWFDEIGI